MILLRKPYKITEIWTRGELEPIAHELIGEAFDIVQSNPRSALLIGFSALETGLKDYIQFRVPNCDIILEKMPSPPAVAMAREVVPNLHKTLALKLVGFPLPEADSKYLRKWVSQRNQVAYGIKTSINADKLKKSLGLVRNLLYQLDVSRGREWARSLIEADTIEDRDVNAG